MIKSGVEFIIGGIELLEYVGPLWEQLNNHHKNSSINFKEKYKQFTWDDRKEGILQQNKEYMIVLARTEVENQYIGYSISSITKDNEGEIESLYIIPKHRGNGIGEHLMIKPLEWMENKNIKKIKLGVASGNERTFNFYKKFGFFPKTTILERL